MSQDLYEIVNEMINVFIIEVKLIEKLWFKTYENENEPINGLLLR